MTTPAPDTVLALREVSLHFRSGRKLFDHGRHTVLDAVSLEVQRGETLGIIGRNGCGKSTVLRLMAGILGPSSGHIELAPGVTVALLSLGLGFKPTLSGRNNALLACMLQGYTQAQALACIDDIKAFSELGDSFEEPVQTYSSGMRSRLGFSTAIVSDVDVLLIDEILSVGDAQFRRKAQETLVSRISGEQTVVFVSHNPEQVRTLCQRTVWLEGGRVACVGPTDKVLAAYNQRMSQPAGKA